MKIKSQSRRMFLQSAGGYLLTVPFLPSLLTREVLAQTTSPPKRFIAVMSRLGTHHPAWYPAVGASRLIGTNVRERGLSEVPGPISEILGSHFDALKPKLLLIRGLDAVYPEGHNTASMLGANCGHGDGSYTSLNITADHVLGRSPKIYSGEPAYRVLSLSGTSGSYGMSFFNSGGNITRYPYVSDPRALFEKLFGATAGMNAEQIAAYKSQKKSILDRVLADYQRVWGSKRLSAADRQVLDSHLSSIRDIERKTVALSTTPSTCAPITAPASVTSALVMYSNPTELDHRAYMTSMIDMIVAAIRCDQTRILSYVFSHPGAQFNFLGTSLGHHTISHTGNATGELYATKFDQYFSQFFADLLTKLDVVEDTRTGSTYLDNTVAVWGHEFAGMATRNHKGDDLPILMGGGAGLFKMGRYVDYRRPGVRRAAWNDSCGIQYNQFLVTLFRGFGLTPAEYEQGTPGFGAYYPGFAEKYDFSDAGKRAVLPGLLKV